MRLPAKPGKQQRTEEARELHELLWRTYLDPALGRVFIASDQAGLDLIKLSGNLHRFWTGRGFRLQCKQVKDKTGFHVWLSKGKNGDRQPEAPEAA
jgi:hypothetical protein